MFGKVQARMLAKRIGMLILAAPLLIACEGGMPELGGKAAYLTNKPLDVNAQGTRAAAFSAALTPLEDIGLRKRQIPEMLQMLSDNPYTPPEKIVCDEVKKEMADLNVLLGADIDTPKVALSAQDQMIEDGTNMISDAVVGLVRSQANIVPFRSIVRRLTGAASHEKAVNRAVEAGKLRRAYLRGVADAKFGSSCIPKLKVITAEAEKPSEAATDEQKSDAEPLEVAKK